MAKRHFVFLIEGQEVVMPVTPQGYKLPGGIKVSTVHLTQWGDYVLPGRQTASPFSMTFLLPAQTYPFMSPGSVADPEYYYAVFMRCMTERLTIRLIITGADLSQDVLVGSVSLSEIDGTCDRNLELQLFPRRKLSNPGAAVAGAGGLSPALRQSATDAAAARAGESTPHADAYRVEDGDTLWGIARQAYGTVGVVSALAAYNGLNDPTLIRPGMVLQLPDAGQL